MLTQLLTAKVAAAAAAVVLTATTAAAATGSLPEAAQNGAAKAASAVGINIPHPSEDRPTGNSDHPTGNADNSTDADEHGETVSSVARETEATGGDKGAEISDAARGDHGQGAPDAANDDTPEPAATGTDHNPAPVETPNRGAAAAGHAQNDGTDAPEAP